MINHITLRVGDLQENKKFFSATLGQLGYKLLREKEKTIGYGVEDVNGKRDFWIGTKGEGPLGRSFCCLAFTAHSKQMVDAFYKAALEVGGKDNGAPGYRKRYSPGYYAAYVLSPDGYNIEAVFDDPSVSK